MREKHDTARVTEHSALAPERPGLSEYAENDRATGKTCT